MENNQQNKEYKFVVYEYNENASSMYVGCRFMSMWTEPIDKKTLWNALTIIAEDVTQAEAERLIKEEKKSGMDAFIESMPPEIMTPNAIAFLKSFKD